MKFTDITWVDESDTVETRHVLFVRIAGCATQIGDIIRMRDGRYAAGIRIGDECQTVEDYETLDRAKLGLVNRIAAAFADAESLLVAWAKERA